MFYTYTKFQFKRNNINTATSNIENYARLITHLVYIYIRDYRALGRSNFAVKRPGALSYERLSKTMTILRILSLRSIFMNYLERLHF